MTKSIALQLYTVRDHTSRDFVGTLKKVAEIGYKGFEFAGFGGLSAKELRSLTQELGVVPISSHIALDALQKTDETLAYAQELGLAYVVCPYLPEELRQTADDYRRLAEILGQIGEAFAEGGITFCYHNHDFEFKMKTPEGAFAFDLLFANKSVQTELDVYWVEKAGLQPTAFIAKYADRIPLLHLKDMAKDETRSFAELGTGSMDIPELIETGSKSGVQWFVVEQDVCNRDSLESATISLDYLRSLGYAN